eukprot:5346627-Amphidinium_carterae.1
MARRAWALDAERDSGAAEHGHHVVWCQIDAKHSDCWGCRNCGSVRGSGELQQMLKVQCRGVALKRKQIDRAARIAEVCAGGDWRPDTPIAL